MENIYYIIENGKVLVGSNAKGNYNINEENLYISEMKNGSMLVINTFKDKCIIIPKDILQSGVSKEVYELLCTPKETNLNSFKEIVKEDGIRQFQDFSNTTTFILAITYSCNLKCKYCYQQYNPQLDKKLISEENLDYILSVIKSYMEQYPDKVIELGLFGGEPLLKENENVIDIILDFCKKYGIQMHITSNGCNLDYYIKKLVINRKIISSINLTIDSLEFNEETRRNPYISKFNSSTAYLLTYVKTLLYYGIPVDVATNIDKHNLKEISFIKEKMEAAGLLKDKNFSWDIGRVDDRLYETNYPDIVMEYEIINELLTVDEIPENMHAAFIKTGSNILRKMNVDFHQTEIKGKYNYCWSSSDFDTVFYVDNNLNAYRCTYTVGRVEHSVFRFSLENICKYKPQNRTYLNDRSCISCRIGGYCSGGCRLSYLRDRERQCIFEKEAFDNLINNIFIPYLEKILDLGEM